ncbi:hypothetical protein GCM10022404_20550 [Celeribacter arenosi]|uniref:Uncharacterized protein n=1 Tax=Celeribacter arenosi TaxID=792649 RepID=A0ABP7K9N7_9RHOB
MGFCITAQARECSRPPLPKINIFMCRTPSFSFLRVLKSPDKRHKREQPMSDLFPNYAHV